MNPASNPVPDPHAADLSRAIFVDGMGRISEFWGISPVMGRLWAVLYLSPEAQTMDDLVDSVGITKGHASTNLRALLRLGLVHKSWRPGDRKDYYTAQSDMWTFARGILRERQQKEFDAALASSVNALAALESAKGAIPMNDYRFLAQRLGAIRDFNATIDRAVAALLKLEDLRSAVSRLTSRRGAPPRR